MFKTSLREMEVSYKRHPHRTPLPASMSALRPLIPGLFHDALANTGDEDVHDQMMATILVHRNKGRLMRFGFALAEERISDRNDPVSAQQVVALTLVKEIFAKIFSDDAAPEALLEMFILKNRDHGMFALGARELVGVMDLAVTGKYGPTLRTCTSSFLHSIPGYSFDTSKKNIDITSKRGGHQENFMSHLNLVFAPMKAAFMDLVLAHEKAHDRDTVKRLASVLKDLTSGKLSVTYETLSKFCGYESWNHMSTVLKEDLAAA